jgi:DNA polymerase III epsilon subunit-like protein
MIVLDFLAGIWRRLAVGDSTPLDALLDPGFVAIDVETTGLNPRRDAIVAVAAIPFEAGRSRPGFVTLVNPRRPIPAQSTAIHGINDAAVATAPSIVEVLPRFDSVCTRRIVIGHDVAFDVAVLEQSAIATRVSRCSPRSSTCPWSDVTPPKAMPVWRVRSCSGCSRRSAGTASARSAI